MRNGIKFSHLSLSIASSRRSRYDLGKNESVYSDTFEVVYLWKAKKIKVKVINLGKKQN